LEETYYKNSADTINDALLKIDFLSYLPNHFSSQQQ
jgi:hypothetical protein